MSFFSELCRGFGCTRKKKNQNNENNNPSYIESGQFGFTYVDGDKVIKIYTEPTTINKIYTNATYIANKTGNNNQRVEIVHGLKKKNLPINVRNRVSGNSNTTLQAIRMPHLGIDLLAAITKPGNITRLRMLPISTLMGQCHKLIKNIDIIIIVFFTLFIITFTLVNRFCSF
jgi:hypothetical protein